MHNNLLDTSLKYGIIAFTLSPGEVSMGKEADAKLKVLREKGCLHARPEQVVDELFQQSDFFDPRDLIQVKYEMLRQVLLCGQKQGHTFRVLLSQRSPCPDSLYRRNR